MKLFYTPAKPYLSHSFQRVWEGLDLTKPAGSVWVDKMDDADFIFAPVVNWDDVQTSPVDKRWVILQFCFLTAGGTITEWQNLWRKAKVVMSYLNLPFAPYLRVPLGYDHRIFYPMNLEHKYRAITTGYVDGLGAEYIKDVWRAFGNIMHVGANFALGEGYHHTEKISDTQLRVLYNSADYVVSLRDVEGFELPLLEGAACGAVPVALDLECYKRWYSDTALFVRPTHVLEDLQRIAAGPVPGVQLSRLFEWDITMLDLWRNLK